MSSVTHYCLHQTLTHRADKPFVWAVEKIVESGQRPEPLGVHDEPPAELVRWAKHLNSINADVAFDFGIADRHSLCSGICAIDRESFTPIDPRGRWIVATGFGNGSARPYGLGLRASWQHCETLAKLLDEHYATDSKPAPAAPPAKPRELTPTERYAKASDDLKFHCGGAISFARGHVRSAADDQTGIALADAIARLIESRLALK